jgi:hypothetical protein
MTRLHSRIPRDAPGQRLLTRRGCLLALAGSSLGLLAACDSFRLNLLTHAKVEENPAQPARPKQYSFRLAPYIFSADFEIKRTQPLFTELAQLGDQVYRTLQLPPGDATVQVFLFENRPRYDQFMQAHYPKLPQRRAFFVAIQRTMGGDEDLYVFTFWNERIRQDLRHELTHALLHSVIKNVPLWLDEGLAEYFEVPAEMRTVNAEHVANLVRELADRPPDLARLEAIRDVDSMGRPEYREAWAWVHLMLHTRPVAKKVLLTYLQELRRQRSPGALSTRLVAVFPNLEQALREHVAQMDASKAADNRPAAQGG